MLDQLRDPVAYRRAQMRNVLYARGVDVPPDLSSVGLAQEFVRDGVRCAMDSYGYIPAGRMAEYADDLMTVGGMRQAEADEWLYRFGDLPTEPPSVEQMTRKQLALWKYACGAAREQIKAGVFPPMPRPEVCARCGHYKNVHDACGFCNGWVVVGGRGQPCGCKAQILDSESPRSSTALIGSKTMVDHVVAIEKAGSHPSPSTVPSTTNEVATAARDLAQFDQSIGGYTPPKATAPVRFPTLVRDLRGEA